MWYISIPARLSPTGNRCREYFKTKKEAEKRSSILVRTEKHFADIADKVSPDLLRDAIELNDLSQIYGFKGLRDAFMTLTKDFEEKNKVLSLGEIFAVHEADGSYYEALHRSESGWIGKKRMS